MDQLFIATKISIPLPPATALTRPQLFRRLHDALTAGQRLVLISAPAGFGKTSLLSTWMHEQQRYAVAWLSLDANDNYPEIFFHYLLATFGKAAPTATLPPFLPSWSDLTDSTLRLLLVPLVNALAAHAAPLVLVLDDFHLITNQLVHNAIAFLLKYLPVHVQLVIASRTDPPLPLANLRARQQMSDMRMPDLRFSPNEIRRFFASQQTSPIADTLVESLDQWTEGWAVGLQLAALAMRDGAAQAALNVSYPQHAFVWEYLTAEVFAQLPVSIQRFLVRTAIVERLTDGLCQALLADVADTPTLDEVVQRNLFLTHLGDASWYQYHHLFGAFLRAQLQQRESPETITALHVRASRWLLLHGQQYEAIRHLVHAEAWEEMLAVLTPAPPIHEIFSTIHIWRRWIDHLPSHLLRRHPDLFLIKLWGMVLSGDGVGAEAALEESDIVFPPASQGNLAVLRQHIAFFHGQPEHRIAEGMRALELLSPQEQPLLWSMTAVILSSRQAISMSLQVLPLLEQAWQIAASLGEPMVMLLAAGTLSEIALRRGKLRRAAHWIDEVRHLVTNGYTIGAPYWCRVAARIAYEQNNLTEVVRVVQQGRELVQLTSRFHNTPEFNVILVRASEALGTSDDASIDALLTEGSTLSQRYGLVREQWEIEATRVRRWIARGELVQAIHWGEAHPLQSDTPLTYNTHWLVVAHVYLQRAGISAHTHEAETALARAIAATSAAERMYDNLQLLILQALLWWAHGRCDEAAAMLGTALALVAPEGYLRLFLDAGQDVVPLLAHPQAEQAAPELVARLGVMLALDAPPARPGIDSAEILSARELEILRLVATGLSVQQLADRLIISVHTARTHLKSIYTKLDVHSRMQAIDYARQHGLL